MAYTYLLYHIIIRPKSSKPVIVEEHEKLLYSYIHGICKQKKCVLHRINGKSNHIHMLVEVHSTIAIADFVRDLKLATNQWMKQHRLEFPNFEAWGRSYCALTYCNRDKELVRNYIINQKEHHKSISFKDEYVSLLEEFGIQPDEWMLKD